MEITKGDIIHFDVGEGKCSAAIVLQATHQYPWHDSRWKAEIVELGEGRKVVATSDKVHPKQDCPNRFAPVEISEVPDEEELHPHPEQAAAGVPV